MTELISVKNVSYNRYEELLLRRDSLKKASFQYEQAYIREFGDLILEIFQVKLECIRKKKTIEYCQRAANYGKAVDQRELQEHLQKELAAFQAQLDGMMKENEIAKDTREISEIELLKIKKIYHKLVKIIHPDINPAVEKSEIFGDLWNRVTIAYNCNDLKLMEEAEVLIHKALEQAGVVAIDIEIPNIEEKIAEVESEIKTIRETDPYQYKYLLEDPEAVVEKKKSLKEEKREYEEYAEYLEGILNGILQNGVNIIWKMH